MYFKNWLLGSNLSKEGSRGCYLLSRSLLESRNESEKSETCSGRFLHPKYLFQLELELFQCIQSLETSSNTLKEYSD